jgi:hypothetical protein
MADIVDRLLNSEEPSVRFKVRVGVLGEDPESGGMLRLREEIRDSPRVRTLLSERRADGTLPHHPYAKWRGSHWLLTMLADLGYPTGDLSLEPMVDRASSWALSQEASWIQGRARRCASQEGNALLYLLRLGLKDERCAKLAEKLIELQWPDGGWNCDRRPEACHSSFHESLIPMRALYAYSRATGDQKAGTAADATAEMFLERELLFRKTTGEIIRPPFAMTHYPYFWQYSFLHALNAMAEGGMIRDPRCSRALNLLESKRLPDGGFPAERRYYSVIRSGGTRRRTGQTTVEWGPTGKTRSNEFVTAEALRVLRAAGRI